MSPPPHTDPALPEDRSRSLRSLRSSRLRRFSLPPPSRCHPPPSSSRPPSPRGALPSFSGGGGGVSSLSSSFAFVLPTSSRRRLASSSSGWGKTTGPPRPPPAMSFPSGDVVVTPFVRADDENDGAVAPPQARNFSRTSRATTTMASKMRTARIASPRAPPSGGCVTPRGETIASVIVKRVKRV